MLLLDLLVLLTLFRLGGLGSLAALLALLGLRARLSLLCSSSALSSNASSLLPGKLSFPGSLLLHLCKLDGSLLLLLLLLCLALLLISGLLDCQLALLLRILLLLNLQLPLLLDLGLRSLDLHGLISLQLSDAFLLSLLLGKHSFALLSSFLGCEHALALRLLHLALLDGQLSLTLSLGLSALDLFLLLGSEGSSSLPCSDCSVSSSKSLSASLGLSSTLFGEHDVAQVVSMTSCMNSANSIMVGVVSSGFLLSLTSLVGCVMIARHGGLSSSSGSLLHAKSMGFTGCLNTSLLHGLSFLHNSSTLTSSSSSLGLNTAEEGSATGRNSALTLEDLLFTLLLQPNLTSFCCTNSGQFLCSQSCNPLSLSNDSLFANSCHVRLSLCNLLLSNFLHWLSLCPNFLSRAFTLDDSRLSHGLLSDNATLLSASARSSASLSLDDSLILSHSSSRLSASSSSSRTLSLSHSIGLGINLNKSVLLLFTLRCALRLRTRL